MQSVNQKRKIKVEFWTSEEAHKTDSIAIDLTNELFVTRCQIYYVMLYVNDQ